MYEASFSQCPWRVLFKCASLQYRINGHTFNCIDNCSLHRLCILDGCLPFTGQVNHSLYSPHRVLTQKSGGVLFTTLGFSLLLSGFLTAFAISAYLSGRLVLVLRRSGRHGFRIWLQEVTQIFSPWSVHLASADEDQYASEDSGFLVGKGTKDDYTTQTVPLPGERSDIELKDAT